MEVSLGLRSFLKENGDLIKQNKWEELYWKYFSLDTATKIGELTCFLLALGINPLLYMKNVPESYLYLNGKLNSNCFYFPVLVLTIPDTIKHIKQYAFAESELSSIDLPNSLLTIGTSAFDGCIKLTNITIPKNVTTIHDGAFINCLGLKSVIFEKGSECEYIGFKTFSNCDSLVNIILPENLKTIECETFFNCDKLKSIDIPDKVARIGTDAFCDCPKLTIICHSQKIKDMIIDSGFSEKRIIIK